MFEITGPKIFFFSLQHLWKRAYGLSYRKIGILTKRVSGKQAKNGYVWKRTLLNEGGGVGVRRFSFHKGKICGLLMIGRPVVTLQNTGFITETGKGSQTQLCQLRCFNDCSRKLHVSAFTGHLQVVFKRTYGPAMYIYIYIYIYMKTTCRWPVGPKHV